VTLILPLPASSSRSRLRSLLRHAVESAEVRLRAPGPAAGATQALRASLRALESDPSPFEVGVGAVAVYADGARLLWVTLPRPALYTVAVAGSFRLRPLLHALEETTPFHLLVPREGAASGQGEVTLFEGDARGLRRLETAALAGGIDSLVKALDGEEEPVVVAGEPAEGAVLGAASRLPRLVLERVEGSVASLGEAELHRRALAVVRAAALRAERRAARGFAAARRRGRASDRLEEVAELAAAGRVRRLWVDAHRSAPGRVEPGSGRIRYEFGEDDVLEDLAVLVLDRGGEVRAVETEAMPVAASAAAMLR
jgi:hypothetical protein